MKTLYARIGRDAAEAGRTSVCHCVTRIIDTSDAVAQTPCFVRLRLRRNDSLLATHFRRRQKWVARNRQSTALPKAKETFCLSDRVRPGM